MKEDLLKKDPKLENQSFALMSFLSPEKIRFSRYETLYSKIKMEKDLKKKCSLYEELLDLRNNLRSLKIRGVFADIETARKYSEKLRNIEPGFDIYVGSVGEWMPWDDSVKTEDYEYAEEELQKLMKQYDTQQEISRKEHEDRKKNIVSSV